MCVLGNRIVRYKVMHDVKAIKVSPTLQDAELLILKEFNIYNIKSRWFQLE